MTVEDDSSVGCLDLAHQRLHIGGYKSLKGCRVGPFDAGRMRQDEVLPTAALAGALSAARADQSIPAGTGHRFLQ